MALFAVGLDLAPKKFQAELKANPAGYLRRIWNRLVAATLLVAEYGTDRGLAGHVARNLLYVLPLLTLLCSAWTRGPNRQLIGLLSLLWGLFLAPYILVAFYVRYLLPLTPVLATVFFLALDQQLLLAWWQDEDGEAVRAFSQLECEGEHIARVRTYFHAPEAISRGRSRV